MALHREAILLLFLILQVDTSKAWECCAPACLTAVRATSECSGQIAFGNSVTNPHANSAYAHGEVPSDKMINSAFQINKAAIDG
jgi:hypothetical protein